MLHIRCRDTGIGIPPDKQKVIFESLRQVDEDADRKFGGTGLGLAISRDLAIGMGGRLEVTSKPGVGSTFSLVIPYYRSSDEIRYQQMINSKDGCVDWFEQKQ